ncbi:MFS transporter, partial [Pseudomonas oryzihabitans]
MPWAIYFAVLGSVISVGLAIGLSMPLVSLRLESWGYGSFAIGVMAASPALGILTGASLAGRLAARVGTPRLMQLCLVTGAASLILLSLLPSYLLWLLLRLALGAILTLVFVLGESWMNQVITDRWRGRLVALYGSSYALSQLAGPLLLGVLGTEGDQGFWLGALLMLGGATLLLGRQG